MDQSAVWLPYCGAAPVPGELLARWNLDPLLIAALLFGTAVFLKFGPTTSAQRRYFLTAIALLALLLVSPFCALTSALFSARAVHHLALTAVVAPLLAAALPAKRVPGGLALWTGLHTATFWIWHAPPVYEAALSNEAVYWLMQASLLLTALALWRAVRHASLPAGIAALLATMVQMGLLGALLTFTGTPLYAPHALGPLAWGLTPLEDQQLAGLIMWAPGAGIYLAAALALASRWFARERRASLAT
nr:cytochrome c oxidase assembly protein [Sphingobium indicum]